ncbi:penicillin-binding protein 1A [Filimonas lacunae]|uniref:Penicillin-binding protein 1A n=1 Tax=Filimonas lacunae TaxID=477680 RepID=A0A173MLF1_9BACT|nr:transglycosylase domain-containing protein [Filimonas lacunae]BAV08463.1 multimodular transpeptidase-transglycosylase [Filimonas lacunae]SIT33979.1 penicillin-binding protein 1A [Filimonas lacunae]
MKKSIKILWSLFLIGLAAVILLFVLADVGALGTMPSISELENPTASLASQVYAEDGTLMGKYYLEDRVNVGFKDISKHVINALVATEDERFYEHNGVDPRSLGRALSSFGSSGGASTITMQTAKNLFTQNWSTSNIVLRMLQKIKESIIAIKLERNFTKDEIITLYLNTVTFGDNVFGIRNAAKTFYQKEPDRLSVEEAAMLVGMLKGGVYNMRRFPKQALERRNVVISQMVRNGVLSSAEADGLKKKPNPINYKKMDETSGIAPYFRMVLGEDMKAWCKEHKKSNGDNYNLYKDGLKIYTTINPIMQQYAEEALAKHYSTMQKVLSSQSDIKSGSVWKGHENILEAAMKQSDRWKNAARDPNPPSDAEIRKTFFEKIPMRVFAWNNNRYIDTIMTPYDSIKYHRQILQAGFMAMDPLRGEIKAWVGGVDFKTFKYDHVNINTKRQVGSTMKPLLYSLAIEDNGFTPNTMVEDVQQSFGSYGQVPATTASCSGQTMPMFKALALSKNCATAYIMKQLGPQGNDGAKRFVNFLKECNIQTKIEPFPSIALGSAEISLYEMMQAYSMFPGRGFNVKPMYITRIEDKNGNVLETFIPQRKEVISEVTSYSVISMMQQVMKYGTGRRMWSYDVTGDIAGKTGTTNDNSDAWFMGYTPQLLGGVWTGCDDRFIRFSSTAMGQGSSVALPIWAYFYEKASKDKSLSIDTKSTFAKPDVMTNELIFDNWNGSTDSINEGEDGGGVNGNSGDYGGDEQVPPANTGEENRYESAPSPNNGGTAPSGAPLPAKPPVNKPSGNPPATLPQSQQPKAVYKKPGTTR